MRGSSRLPRSQLCIMGDEAEIAVEAPADAETVKPAEDAKPTPPRGPVKRYAK